MLPELGKAHRAIVPLFCDNGRIAKIFLCVLMVGQSITRMGWRKENTGEWLVVGASCSEIPVIADIPVVFFDSVLSGVSRSEECSKKDCCSLVF